MTAAALVQVDEVEDAESRRRDLMAESDHLLDAVEMLRLADESEVPPSLQGAIDALQRRLGRTNPAVARIAWSNYWDLQQEAMAIRYRLGARALSTRAGAPAAPRR